jgi:hypothetical protein
MWNGNLGSNVPMGSIQCDSAGNSLKRSLQKVRKGHSQKIRWTNRKLSWQQNYDDPQNAIAIENTTRFKL